MPGVVVPDTVEPGRRAARRSAPTPRASCRATTRGGAAARSPSTAWWTHRPRRPGERPVDERGRGAEVVLGRDAGTALGGGLGAEVRPHPLGVDLEPLERPAHVERRAPVSASRSQSGSHSACHAPAARSCSCSPAKSAARACTRRAQARARTGPRVSLVRHRRRAAAPGRAPPHLGLCEQHDVQGDLPAGGRDAVERGDELAHAACASRARGRRARRGRARRRRPAARRARVAEQRERSRGAAERGDWPPRASRFGGAHRVEPHGRLQPERRRHRLLQQRPRRHDRRAVLVGKPCARVASPSTSAAISAARVGATSIAAVSRMSCEVAPTCASGTCSRNARTSGSTGSPPPAPLARSRRGRSPPPRTRPRSRAPLPARARPRASREPRAPRDRLAQRVGDEDRAEELAHTRSSPT